MAKPLIKLLLIWILALIVCFLVFVFLVERWNAARPPCGRYVMYDDKLTGQLWGDLDTALAQGVVKAAVFELPPGMSYPCTYNRDQMRVVYETREPGVIAEFLAALRHKREDSAYSYGPGFLAGFGAEFETRDGRTTFFEISVHPQMAYVTPLPEERYGYNEASNVNRDMLLLLQHLGILQRYPGYEEFSRMPPPVDKEHPRQ